MQLRSGKLVNKADRETTEAAETLLYLYNNHIFICKKQEDLVLRWTYNSNAIEGNTLTLQETKVALEGITIGGKTMVEHFEAINHREAILFMEEIVKKN